MKLKTATLIGLIGAIFSIFVTMFYLFLNMGVINIEMESYSSILPFMQVITVCSNITLVVFFFTLYKNQK